MQLQREYFVPPDCQELAYADTEIPLTHGQTMLPPRVDARLVNDLVLTGTESVLEIGTGSGYQSAYLSYLTDKLWTIEIIKPVAERTRATYDKLITDGYTEFKAIQTRNADGYYGWADAGPFDKIIVTCGIDHVPPPLLQQLKVGGVMVIPVGPPGAQRVLKVVKEKGPDGELKVTRSDIYGGRIVPFVPFTKLENDEIKGTHNK
jgi:protein-L-isoaspartate(D-aspartate) O-methyltransferase